jgi:hypothetical protein
LRASVEAAQRRRGSRRSARAVDVDGDGREDGDGDLGGLSKAELEKRAKEAGVRGYSKMKKDELVDALEAA